MEAAEAPNEKDCHCSSGVWGVRHWRISLQPN